VAAPSLFERCGDAVTILEAIAEQALVSPKTITAVFGSKRELLAEAINPEDASPRVRHLIEELRASEDVSRRLSLVAQIVEQRWEPERYETWLAQLLVQHLLASASG
jgi:AcrR family transcriptional regulator